MILLVVALLVYVLFFLSSIIVTYYVTVLLNQTEEYTLDSIIMLQSQILLSYILDIFTEVVSSISEKALDLAANITVSTKKVLQLLVISTVLLGVSGNLPRVLSIMDESWRCVVFPFFNTFAMSLAQVGRLVYDTFIPLYNYYYVVTSQATKGTIAIALKCDFQAVLMSLKLMLRIFINIFSSIDSWSGMSTNITRTNNIFVNEFNVTSVINASQNLLAHQEETLSCICNGLEPVFDIVFEAVKDPNFPVAISHGLNAVLSFGQTFIGVLPFFAQFPDFRNTTYHTNAFLFHAGRYIDQVSTKIISKTILLFDDEFNLEGLPDQFIFQSMSHIGMGFTHAVHTIARTGAHILIPIPYYITDSTHMMKAMQFNEAFQEWNAGLYLLSNNGYWLLEVTDKLMKEAVETVTPEGVIEIPGIPETTTLVCNDPTNMKWSAKTACAAYVSAEAIMNVAYIGTNLITEILWKSFLNREQNILITLQRYDGPSYGTVSNVNCQYRKTVSWDMTQKNCICDISSFDTYYRPEYTIADPFGAPRYDPYCGQPTLSANVFSNVERAVVYASTAGFDPLIGDFLATNVMIVNNLIRSSLKFVLSIPSMLENEFFQNKVNCGYGVSEIQLEEWWLETRDIRPCQTPKSGYMKQYDGRTFNVAIRKYEELYSGCVPIHETIRFAMCADTKNKKGEVCTHVNKAGCVCNLALPLSSDSLCQCISKFPDRRQEVTQGAFENQLLDKLYDNSEHFCNTFLLEPVYFQLDRYAFILDRFLGQFHPAFDTQESTYCELKSYALANTNVMHYSFDEFNTAASLFDELSVEYSTKACKLYGSYDIICSASMTIRSAVRLVISQVREVTMTLFHVFSGNFETLTVDISSRLCDIQRTIAGLASFTSDILNVVAAYDVKAGGARVIFAMMNAPVVLLDMLNTVIQFVVSIAKGEVNWSKPTQPVFDLIIQEMKIGIDYLRLINGAMGSYFSSLAPGAGSFFDSLNDIINILEDFLNDAVIEMLNLIFRVGMNLISMLTTGNAPDISQFFSDLWTLITKFIQILLQNAGKLLDVVLEMLGPIGSFIKGFASDVCLTIQDVLCTLTAGGTCDLSCAGGEAASFSPPPFVADTVEVASNFFTGLFSRRLHSSLHNFPKLIAELKWDGTSECDMVVNALKDVNFTDLRVLERTKLLSCVDERLLAVKIAKQTDLDLPVDMIYNWKRKWLMLKDFTMAGWIVTNNEEKDIFHLMKKARINPKLYGKLWRQLRTGANEFLQVGNINRVIHRTFSHLSNVSTSDTTIASAYRIYNHTSTALIKISKVSDGKILHHAHKLKYHLGRFQNFTLPSIPRHLHHAKETWKRVRLRDVPPQSTAKRNVRKYILKAAGVQTNMDCTDGAVCLNCLVVENLISTTLNEGKRMAGYYTNTYPVVVESFQNYFSEESAASKAWRADMANLMQEAAARAARELEDSAQAAGEAVGKFSEEQIKAIERGYKLKRSFKVTNSTFISVWKRARKDWEYFWQNWKLRDTTLIDILEKFLTTTDDSFVPLFGHSLSWFATYPFIGTCSMEVIYCTQSTTQERMDKITDSLWYMLYFTIALFLFQYITELPLPGFLLPYIAILYGFIYVLTVYDWIYPCFPNVPNCLVDDITAWVNKNIPDCWCSYFPGLAYDCELETCHLCSLNTEFRSCDDVPYLENLSIFWAPLFYARKEYSNELIYMYDTIPYSWLLRRFDSVTHLAQSIKENVQITDVENDCFNLKRGDIVLAVIAIYISFEALSIAVPLTLKSLSSVLKVIMMLFAVIYNMALSIELQPSLENTYQKI